MGPVDFSDLFLTCSVDWTVKLWRAKSLAKPSTSSHLLPPVYSFEEADDYVYDVKWHPSHPAIWASVDGLGKFDVWNLNLDTEVGVFLSLAPGALLFNSFCVGFCRFLSFRRPLGPDSRRSINSNGIVRRVDELLWAEAMVDCTFMILEIWLFRENRSGRICRRLLRVWEVEVWVGMLRDM